MPRIGWIPASFDPSAMGQEVATLSEENRKFHELLATVNARKPKLDFYLESNEDLHFMYESPNVLVRRMLSPEDISQELIDQLQDHGKTVESNADLISRVFEEMEVSTQEEGINKSEESIVRVVDAADVRKNLFDRIEKHNTELPSQSDYDTVLMPHMWFFCRSQPLGE